MSKELLDAQYTILAHGPEEYTQIRVFPKVWFCKGREEFVKEGLKHLTEDAYVGVQARSRLAGDISAIDNLRTLCVDVDPVRPKDTGSTDEQHAAAIEQANRIAKEVGNGYVVSSGSGAHVYFPIETVKVEDRDALSASLKEWNDQIKAKYSTKDIKIDNIWDLPRVIRLWGSTNSRSKRVCGPVTPLSEVVRSPKSFPQTPKAKKHVPEIITDELTQKFNRLCRANKRLKEISEGTISFQSPSEADYEFVALLCRSQFTVDEVKALWEYNHGGNKEPKKGDVERIFGKVEETKDQKAYSLANNSSSYFDTLSFRRMGIRSGFNTLDEMISGFKEGKIYILAARPGTGKTTFGMQILSNMAEQGIPCLMFPTEVGAEPLIDKILSRKCGVELKKFQNGTFTKTDLEKIEEMRGYISNLPLTIYDDFGLDIDAYEKQIDKYAPKVVCLDYFQALSWKDASSLGEKEDTVRRIKKITKDRNIITICMSQLNRASTGKAAMAELKGTSALEELADVIAQVYKSDKGHGYPTKTDMIITKSKYSAAGPIYFDFFNTTANFAEGPENEGMH